MTVKCQCGVMFANKKDWQDSYCGKQAKHQLAPRAQKSSIICRFGNHSVCMKTELQGTHDCQCDCHKNQGGEL